MAINSQSDNSTQVKKSKVDILLLFTMADSACQHTTTWAAQTAPTCVAAPLTLMAVLQMVCAIYTAARCR